MRIMFVLIEECAQQFAEYFKKPNTNYTEIELKDVFTRFTNDVIATTAFGIKCDSLKDKDNEFQKMGRDLTNFTGIRSLKFLLHSISPLLMKAFKVNILPEKPAEFFQSIIKNAIKTRETQNIVRPDMIHLLLKARNVDTENGEMHSMNISDFEIAAQAMIFFLAGFETVSSTLSFTVYELAINPEIQDKLIEEIHAVYEENQGKPTYEAITNMKYMDMVISGKYLYRPDYRN